MHKLSQKIYKSYEKAAAQESPRRHLGASQIGEKCERKLWYAFRGIDKKTFDGRMLRLFETGELEEIRIIRNLRDVGVKVVGEQHQVSAVNGHFGGSMDAIGKIDKDWFCLEFKTHNEKSFNHLKKHKLKESKPMHYAQLTTYMHLEEIKLGIYIAINKNTDEIYEEAIELDSDFAKDLIEKAKRIIYAKLPPERISERADWYECKMCDYHEVCHKEKIPRATCLTCCYARPIDDGAWECEHGIEDGLSGCDKHLYIPELMTHSEAIKYESGAITYVTNKDKKEWTNGPKDIPSSVVQNLGVEFLGDGNVGGIVKGFGVKEVNKRAN